MTYLIMSGTYYIPKKRVLLRPKIELIKTWSGNILLPKTDKPNHFKQYRERWFIKVTLFKTIWE